MKAVGLNPNLGSDAFSDEDLHIETSVDICVTNIRSIVLGSIILELLAWLCLDLMVLSIILHGSILRLYNFYLLAYDWYMKFGFKAVRVHFITPSIKTPPFSTIFTQKKLLVQQLTL